MSPSASADDVPCRRVRERTAAGNHWVYVRVKTNKGHQVRPVSPPAPEGRVDYHPEQVDARRRHQAVSAGQCFALTVSNQRNDVITWTRVAGHKSVRTRIDNVAPYTDPTTPIDIVVEVSDADYVYASGARVGQLRPLKDIPAPKKLDYLRDLTLETLELSDNPGRSLEALASALDVDEWQIAYATVKFTGGAGCNAKCLDNPELRLNKAAAAWARRYRDQFNDARLPFRLRDLHATPP